MQRTISISEVNTEALRVATAIADGSILYGVPRGGIPAAWAVAYAGATMGKNITVTDSLALSNMIIDDIYDSGATRARYQGYAFEVLFDKKDPRWKDQWLVMPWEHSDTSDESATDIITRLLQYIGEDPTREGLQDTPQRVLKAWKEWAWGYDQDPKAILKTFEDGAENVDEMVIVHNIPIISKCEHHLADITGIAHIGYIPDGKIVGLSKLPRLAEIFSRRLQVQERLTNQIADTLQASLKPLGVGVVLRASHACMATRGVNIQGSVTTTSAMRGVLLDRAEARAEFLALCRDAEK